ncbi:MAG: hypothetical protein COB85_04815 [Bacteroidetes bacterium]|nr:MAG: hypothetical protein COB85_04815 [Bacteroidota bacterium]
METKFPFTDPSNHKPLQLEEVNGEQHLVSDGGSRYNIHDAIPDLKYPTELDPIDQKAQVFYDNRAKAYESNMHLTFKTHRVNEQKCREEFIGALDIKNGDKVLDLACGTGRDSVIIAESLGDSGVLCMVDIAVEMLKICKAKMDKFTLQKHFCTANACYLPFPDNYFDSTYSFGALGEFSDIKGSLAEMVRVTKTGGKIVVGDESMPPWLRNSYFYKVLKTTNPQFEEIVPLKEIPIEARDFRLRYVINGVFYLIDFRVGEGEPDADFDFAIPGVRGGTYRTRYDGQLEGVTPEAKSLLFEVIEKKGISMHEWLDELVKNGAEKELKGGKQS